MKRLLLILLLLTATGCAQYGTAMTVGTAKGAEAADKALEAAIWYVCKGASIGAVERRFGRTPSAYRALCYHMGMGVIGQ